VAQGRRAAAEELVTVLAHDLRNYLTPIKGRIELIQRRAERESRQDYLSDANTLAGALMRLDRLVTDLLDVARLEQGVFAIQPRPTDLAALVAETAAALSVPQGEVRVEGVSELVIDADPDRLRQALENLIVNALKHSPEGAPVVVALHSEPRPDGEWAVISVSDQGPGIPQDVLSRIFTRFAVGPGSTGLGLGLYLASRIAAVHGGALTVDTAPGRGATFRLALPA
jgi:two-component system, OmpR family, sensor kinase